MPKPDRKIQFERLCKGNWNNIVDFLNSNKDFVPSSICVNLIMRNGSLSWKQADEIYDLFVKNNYKPDTECLYYISTCPLNYDVINTATKIITSLNETHASEISRIFLGMSKIKLQTSFINKFMPFVNIKISITLDDVHSMMKNNKKRTQIYNELSKFNTGYTLETNNTDILAKYFNNLKETPTIETMEIACSAGNTYIFDQICKKGIYPTQNCMYRIFENGVNAHMIMKLYDYKLFIDQKCFGLFLNYLNTYRLSNDMFNKFIMIFRNYGLLIDIKCVDKALKHKYTFTDLTLFEIDYDEKIMQICYKHSTYPDTYVNKINTDPLIIKMRQMFCGKLVDFNTKEKIHEFITKNNLVPDKYCFFLAYQRSKWELCTYIIDETEFALTLDDIIPIENKKYRILLYEKFKSKSKSKK